MLLPVFGPYEPLARARSRTHVRHTPQPQLGGQAHCSPQPHALPQQQRFAVARAAAASRAPQETHAHALEGHGEQVQEVVVASVVMAHLGVLGVLAVGFRRRARPTA
jgi:hypothetical protein